MLPGTASCRTGCSTSRWPASTGPSRRRSASCSSPSPPSAWTSGCRSSSCWRAVPDAFGSAPGPHCTSPYPRSRARGRRTALGLDAGLATGVSGFLESPLIAKAAIPRTTTTPAPIAIIIVVLDFAAALGTGREPPCFATERVEEAAARPLAVGPAAAALLGAEPVPVRVVGFCGAPLGGTWRPRGQSAWCPARGAVTPCVVLS